MSDRMMIDDPLVARLADLREISPSRAQADRVWAAAAREWVQARDRAHRPAGLRLVPVAIAAALVLMFGGSAQVLAATPESPLYGARVAFEQLTVALLPEDARAERLASLVRQRQGEVARLEAAGSAAASVAATARDDAARAYAEVVPQEPPRSAAPLPVAAPDRPDVTVMTTAPRANETLFSGRVVTTGMPVAGACVTLGSARCLGTTDASGRFTLSAAVTTGVETPLFLYAPSGELLASLRFTASGAAVQLLGEIVLSAPTAPSPFVPSATPAHTPTFSPPQQPTRPPVLTAPTVTFPPFSAPPLPPSASSAPVVTSVPVVVPTPLTTPAPVTITLSGTVRYRSGAPAAGACVVVPAQGDCAALSDAGGAFRLRITALQGSPILLYAYVRTQSAFALGSAALTAGTDQTVTIVLD